MWINISGMNDEAFQRLCKIADYLAYSPDVEAFASITKLNTPVRINVLKQRYGQDIVEDPASVVWRIIGSAVHDVMYRGLGHGYIERAKVLFADKILEYLKEHSITTDSSVQLQIQGMLYLERVKREFEDTVSQIDLEFLAKYLAEERLCVWIDGLKITGINDVYNQEVFKISDYKVTGVDKLFFNDYTEWIQQLNGYAYLRRMNNYRVDSLEINALLRDWMRRKAIFDATYPRQALVVIPLELWSFEKQQEYFTDRVRQLAKGYAMSDEELPVCTSEERWERRAEVAVVEVKGYVVTDAALKVFEKYVSPIDSIEGCKQLLGQTFSTRKRLIEAVCNVQGEDFGQMYAQYLANVSGIRSTDKSGKKPKRALKCEVSEAKALGWVMQNVPAAEWALEHRMKQASRCVGNFCGVREYCSFWQQQQKQLQDDIQSSDVVQVVDD